jgi:sensor histidine kinase YesM
MTYREAAKTYGISSGAVSACVRLYKNKDKKIQRNKNYHVQTEAQKNYQHEARIKDLKHQIADLFLENQMLKKILSKSLQVKKLNGSVITTENLDQLQRDVE